ncbi:hypothetical protein EI427_06600 [Flammeovirga pectinis]|uniref:Uncharacterized protein n=1 Tax=Flammeovirga pectinis TaxID=2494373 RepID=A0A3S9P161_9BACT|nr:hypothetical protein [Flammeovirga pectinis]AZQ61918.1 hypothetical protein EI427_06600 [Flammeovirga pectinis]
MNYEIDTIRMILKFKLHLINQYLTLKFIILYPNLKIRNCFIEKGVNIIVEDGAELTIVGTSLKKDVYIHVSKGGKAEIYWHRFDNSI